MMLRTFVRVAATGSEGYCLFATSARRLRRHLTVFFRFTFYATAVTLQKRVEEAGYHWE